ncbi:BMP family ABC transporter substrate-binding protein [Proteinivorax tanatarense]|uniref:BMP family ABC transporter substrate-binding protein n=1 Tax=Proteinivorax tanatarense TaxID=1260629 RepID=A0AAU7VQT5_9FIRM
MKKSLIMILAAMMVLSFALAGCGAGSDADDNGAVEENGEDPIRVGLVLSTGGLGDQSFNDAAFRGLEQAEEELGIEFDYYEPEDSAEDETALRHYAEQDFDLVIGVGFQMQDTLKEVAEDMDHINFAIVDGGYDEIPENVATLNFAQHEGSFLAGALAALVTEVDTIGFMGGVEGALIGQFEAGFVQGAKHVNPDVDVDIRYVGDFGDIDRGRETARGQVERGADVIYHAAGGSGMGLFEVAEDEEIYAIGVDSNQNMVAPGYVIASMLKRVDTAVYGITEAVLNGEFQGGTNYVFDLADDGVGLTSLTDLDIEEQDAADAEVITQDELEAIEEMKQSVTAEHADKIEELKQQIISGEIVVDME